MSQIEVERFLGRLITDAGFRAKAASSVMSVCCIEGIALSTVEMSFLKHLDFSQFALVAGQLDDSILRK